MSLKDGDDWFGRDNDRLLRQVDKESDKTGYDSTQEKNEHYHTFEAWMLAIPSFAFLNIRIQVMNGPENLFIRYRSNQI